MKGGAQKRLFIAGVVPVATYGSEHLPFKPEEYRQLVRAALSSTGLATPAVPVRIMRACLPAAADPLWRIA